MYNKILNLIKNRKNKNYLLYKIFHYIKVYVPKKWANKIAIQNTSENINNLFIRTYDGSNQIVHPDVVFYDRVYYVAFTPYPYGMDEYENPCVYFGKELETLKPLSRTPLDKPIRRKYGYHLSDPCLIQKNGDLICFYRESIRIKKKDNNSIYFIKYDKETKQWGKKKKLNLAVTGQYLSPAVIYDKNKCYFFYAEWEGEKGSALYYSMVENDYVFKGERIDVVGIPEGFDIWHLSITYNDDVNSKFSNEKKNLKGLFLLRSHVYKSDFVLYRAKSNGIGEKWYLERKIELPEKVAQNVKMLYKSCFLNGKNNYLISYKDIQERYQLYILGDEREIRCE